MSILKLKDRSYLKNRRFMNIFIGYSVSSLGDNMDNMIFMLLAIDLTGSPTATGVLLMILAIPNFIFSLFGGTFADMFDRKKIMVWTSYIRGALIGLILVLFLTNKLTFVWLCVVLFIVESLSRFNGPAAGATMPRLLTKAEFLRLDLLIVGFYRL